MLGRGRRQAVVSRLELHPVAPVFVHLEGRPKLAVLLRFQIHKALTVDHQPAPLCCLTGRDAHFHPGAAHRGDVAAVAYQLRGPAGVVGKFIEQVNALSQRP